MEEKGRGRGKKALREKAALEKEEKKNLASQLTDEALEQLDIIENILTSSLNVSHKVNWEDLKDSQILN